MRGVEPVLIYFTQDGGRTYFGASGLLFSEGLVITCSSIFIPLLYSREDRDWLESFLRSVSPTLEVNQHINKFSFRVFREVKNTNGGDQIQSKTLQGAECDVVGVWKCPLIAQCLENLFCDWALRLLPDKKATHPQQLRGVFMSKELVSTFMLLKFNGTQDKTEECVSALSKLLLTLVEPNRGDEIQVESTPFGNQILVNSFSRGIISNVIGTEKCFFLVDARTVVGCEGGPIFSLKKYRNRIINKLIGLVVCPLTWWKSEWVGLTIGISLIPVLKRVLQSKVDSIIFTEVSTNKSSSSGSVPSPFLENVDETIVLVRCDDFWGSGCVLNAASGTILTCAHVAKSVDNVSVYYKGKYYAADVVFKSQNSIAYDLAVIRTKGRSIFKTEMKFYKKTLKKGDTVVAAGFPFVFQRVNSEIRPSIVRGTIARISPHMLQTTCCILFGFSGGALLLDGKLIGIIICNTRDLTGGFFPHLNFAVPASVFADSISKYLETNDVQYLRNLENFDPKVQSIWSLQSCKL